MTAHDLVGLGICIAFRGGVINIGGEGQIIVGALATTAFTLALPEAPLAVLLPGGLICGMLAGGVWGGIAGALKARFGVNEILTTIMMNAIAAQLSNFLLRGPMIDPREVVAGTMLAQSARLPESAWLPRLIPQTLLHAGAILALGMALLKTGNTKEAIGAGLMATTLKPNDLLAWTALSQMYVKNGQIAEAEDAKGKARILSLGGKVVKE